MAAMNIPLVPVNSEAKTFAASALVQAINNMHLAQNASGGGAGHSAASTEAQKKAAQEDAAAKDQARKDAAAHQTDKRGILEQGGVSKITGQAQPRMTGLEAAGQPTVSPAMPSAPSSGITGQPGGSVTGVSGTVNQFGNIPVQEAAPSTGEVGPVQGGGGFNSDSMFDWGSMFGSGL